MSILVTNGRLSAGLRSLSLGGASWLALALLAGCEEYDCSDLASCPSPSGSTGDMSLSTGASSPGAGTEVGETTILPQPPTETTVEQTVALPTTGTNAADSEDSAPVEASTTRPTSNAQPSSVPPDESTAPVDLCASSNCDDGQSCDPETGLCVSTCEGCVIDGRCYADGDGAPGNSCLVCNPTTSALDWSVTAGVECDDGNKCTQTDTCDGQGQCSGTAVVCTNDDSGVCGATRACNPSSGQCDATYPGSSVSCNDADPCTANDRCDGEGQCAGTPSLGVGCTCISNADCNDNVSCTQDVCTDGVCSHPVQAGSCFIGGACVTNGTKDPSNPCRSCNASSNAAGWTNASVGTSCDDGLWCNGDSDRCEAGGVCNHTYPSNNRCASTTGACEVRTCDESKKNCFQDSSQICRNETKTGCLENSCSSDVMSWKVEHYCSGNRADCSGGQQVSRESQATVSDDCQPQEACNAQTQQCALAIECGDTYCDDSTGLCWMSKDSVGLYTQSGAKTYCSGLNFAGSTDWHLPTNAEARDIMEGCPDDFCDPGEGPGVSGCYWPADMGSCSQNLWLDNDMSAYWVVQNAMIGTAFGDYKARCVAPWPGH